MGVILDQCMSIVNLTSLSWGTQRYSAVAHSFRVMSKSRNFDEMVVGMMHELYGASSYTRALYSCDVDGDPAWKEALDLFVWPIRTLRETGTTEVSDIDLLNCNVPQNLSSSEKEIWLEEETKWSQRFRKWLLRIKDNPIARRVMIYDLEDKLDVLRHPGIYEDLLGPQYFVLPWKKHYEVCICVGRRARMVERIPTDDDAMILRPLKEHERTNLIKKYERARQMLLIPEDALPSESDYTEEEMARNRKALDSWFHDWMRDCQWKEHFFDDEMPLDEDPL